MNEHLLSVSGDSLTACSKQIAADVLRREREIVLKVLWTRSSSSRRQPTYAKTIRNWFLNRFILKIEAAVFKTASLGTVRWGRMCRPFHKQTVRCIASENRVRFDVEFILIFKWTKKHRNWSADSARDRRPSCTAGCGFNEKKTKQNQKQQKQKSGGESRAKTHQNQSSSA